MRVKRISLPSALKRALEELDAEARAELDRYRQKLPAWIGVYLYPNEYGGERADIHWFSRERIPRDEAVPMVMGYKPRFTAIVVDLDRLDPAACYAMRYWMAERRRRLAVERNNPDAQRAAKGLLRWLRAHPPSLSHGARNFVQANVERDATRAAQWRRWQSDAEAIWKNNSNLSRHAVAGLVKRRLQLSEQTGSIARRIRRN
jgi:hypothetical protein